MLHLLDLGREVRIFRLVRREQRDPAASSRSAARADAGGEVLANAVGDQKLRALRPAIAALGEADFFFAKRSEEHTSELQSHSDLVCRLLLEKKKKTKTTYVPSLPVTTALRC